MNNERMEKLLRKVEDEYGIKIDSYEKVTGGFLTENHFLTTKDNKYFLKKYRWYGADRIKEIHDAKKYFFDGGIPVILPVPAKDGNTSFEYEGSPYALFPFVSGKQYGPGEFSEKAIGSMAEMLAKIQLLGKESKVKVNYFFRGWDKGAALIKIDEILSKISEIKDKSEFDIKAKKNLLLKRKIVGDNAKKLEEFGFKIDHLIHGDYIIPNLFFDKGDSIMSVFDWEKTRHAPRFFELWRSIIYTCIWNDRPQDVKLDLAKLYLDAYLKLYPATKEELMKSLEAYAIWTPHSTFVEGEHYLEGNTRTDELLASDIGRNTYLAEHLEELKDYLFKK